MTADKKTGMTILILENVKIQGKKHQLDIASQFIVIQNLR